jgi:ABC-type sulfate/molybdate transport systems ATPase subunit
LDPWIVLTGATGSGSGTVQYTIAPLPPDAAPRRGRIVIGGRAIMVRQR